MRKSLIAVACLLLPTVASAQRLVPVITGTIFEPRVIMLPDGPLIVASNLRVRTNESGYLRISVDTAAAQDGPLINFGNIRLRTNENGYLRVSCDDCGGGGGAPVGATYITQTTNSTLTNEFSLGSLTTGLIINTVSAGTGTPSTYPGTSCTSPQFIRSLDASAVATCADGAPVDAQYWVGAANTTLTAEHNLGGLTTGLVLNTSGTPSTYGGTSCTNQFVRSVNASGAATCATVGATDASNNLRDIGITFTIDGGGSTITTGKKGYVTIPVACTLVSQTLLSTDGDATAGSLVLDIWKDTYANYPPTVADTITASAKPTLSSANKTTDSTLTGWTTTVIAGDILGFNVDSATTVTKVTLVLTCRKSS